MNLKFEPKGYAMLFATTAPALLIFAIALGFAALSLMDAPPPAAVISTGGDN